MQNLREGSLHVAFICRHSKFQMFGSIFVKDILVQKSTC